MLAQVFYRAQQNCTFVIKGRNKMKALYRKLNQHSISNNKQCLNIWRTAAAILLVTIALGHVASEASVQKSASEKFTNNKENEDVKKIWYKFGTPESKKETHWMESTDTWLENERCCRQAECEYDENSKGEAWRGNVRQYDCTLEPDHSTTIQARAEVNKDCSLCIYDVKAEYRAKSGSSHTLQEEGQKIVPDHAFRYDPNMTLDMNDTHTSTYVFENIDPNIQITLSNIDIYIGTRWYNPFEQSQYLEDANEPFDSPFLSIPGPFDIGSNQSKSLPIANIPNRPRSFIYVAGEMTYTIPPAVDAVSLSFIHAQEEKMPGMESDINEDGAVDLWDLASLANAWLVDYN